MLLVRVIYSVFVLIRPITCQSPTPTANFYNDDLAEETQHAICTIISNDIQTSANATVTRQLKGVCTTKQMEQRIADLEDKLLDELDDIKRHFGIASSQHYRSKSFNSNNNKLNNFSNTTPNYEYYDEPTNEKLIVADTKSINYYDNNNNGDHVLRHAEIASFNDTIKMIKSKKVYIYYWEIPSIISIMEKQAIHIRSGDFNVLGHELCLQLYPHYQESDYLGLQLRPNSIFFKKHKFVILEQFDDSKDINSQIFGSVGSYDMVYRVPYEKLRERKYLFNDTVIVKIVIYLDS